MIGDSSLLRFLDAPIVVGDPDGRVVYLNRAFEDRIGHSAEASRGQLLAELFEGGAREAMLRAVMSTCEQGETVRFRLRIGEVGFSAVASPIDADAQHVGVVILLKEEVEGVEHLLALHRDIQEPLDEVGVALDLMLEQTGGRRDPRHRAMVEDALGALRRLRKWSDEVSALVSGAPSPSRAASSIDCSALLRRVARRAAEAMASAQVALEVLVPASLPELYGDAERLESALLRLVRNRLTHEPAPVRMALGARAVGGSRDCAVLISVCEHRGEGSFEGPPPDMPVDKEAVAALGGLMHVVNRPGLGRATLIRFAVDALEGAR